MEGKYPQPSGWSTYSQHGQYQSASDAGPGGPRPHMLEQTLRYHGGGTWHQLHVLHPVAHWYPLPYLARCGEGRSFYLYAQLHWHRLDIMVDLLVHMTPRHPWVSLFLSLCLRVQILRLFLVHYIHGTDIWISGWKMQTSSEKILVSYRKRIYLLLNSVNLTQIPVHSAAYHMKRQLRSQ